MRHQRRARERAPRDGRRGSAFTASKCLRAPASSPRGALTGAALVFKLPSQALKDNFVFSSLSDEQRGLLVACMFEHSVDPGEEVIREGEDGQHFYVVDSGELEVRDNDSETGVSRAVFSLGSGSCFGELAMLYNCPRTCSVVAKTACMLWALDKEVFREYAMRAVEEKRERYDDLLQHVPLFRDLAPFERAFIADSLQQATFEQGEDIVCEGDAGDRFFVLEMGEAKVTKRQRTGAPKELLRYGPASFFGELALLLDQPRQATVTAVRRCRTCFIDRFRFSQLLAEGKLKDLLMEQARDYKRVNEEARAKEEDRRERKKEKRERRRERSSSSASASRGSASRSYSRSNSSSSRSGGGGGGGGSGRLKRRVGPRGETRRLKIADALSECIAFTGLAQDLILMAVDSMYELLLSPGHNVITQGERGDTMYVLEAGELDVLIKDPETGESRAVHRIHSGESVGELALMDPGSVREATVAAHARGARLWCLAQKDFFAIAGAHIMEKRARYLEFLSAVPLFDGIDENAMKQIADAMTEAWYADGEAIVRQGEVGDAFFVLEEGEAVATVLAPGQDTGVEVMRYTSGGFFGELALLSDATRKASIYAVGPIKCARMDRTAFRRLTARIDTLKQHLEGEQVNYA